MIHSVIYARRQLQALVRLLLDRNPRIDLGFASWAFRVEHCDPPGQRESAMGTAPVANSEESVGPEGPDEKPDLEWAYPWPQEEGGDDYPGAHDCNPELEPLATAELRDAWLVGGCPGCCHTLGMFIKDSGSSSLTDRA